jgi:hypothetical protein
MPSAIEEKSSSVMTIVHPVARHRHDLAVGFERTHEAQLLIRHHPGKDAHGTHALGQLRVVQVGEFRAGDHAAGHIEPDLPGDRLRRSRMVTGDHDRAHTGAGQLDVAQHRGATLAVEVAEVGDRLGRALRRDDDLAAVDAPRLRHRQLMIGERVLPCQLSGRMRMLGRGKRLPCQRGECRIDRIV